MAMKKVLIYGILILTATVCILAGRLQSVKREKIRLKANQEVLLSDVRYYRTSDSLNAAGVNRLTLTNKEFSRHCSNLQRTVKELELKVNRLQAASRTATVTEYKVFTLTRDSVIRLAGRTDTLRCIDYRNNYLTVSACMSGREFTGLVESRDTLVQVVHRIPKRFLGIPFGTKAIRQEVTTRNPYSRITYTEYIELKRR